VGFSICDTVYCIYYIAQQLSEVINGMIYGFNFIFCHCTKMFFICEDNRGEGVNVINVACASGEILTGPGKSPCCFLTKNIFAVFTHELTGLDGVKQQLTFVTYKTIPKFLFLVIKTTFLSLNCPPPTLQTL
jgi:hypothetical protein